ncbi:MOSC domain-containing protein [Marinobacter panjinensis]|uniref:MOSC domain-containing protein n=1 Tax=Marinobacter panjinensis TaxID=2576384 RepID=A0A4U6R3C0_9GAMM|nr:MOSC N-terminal beta barrel domain-containing protein [Marinobacter panjinensis]MCR8915589.1 MOSC domain-containing protein [Marinobacter panjinensis]TKV66836.1 MOSC domain-containing protein [Marinobacter panjinensis]
MQVHSLYVYPVKSLAGIQVSSFRMDDFGPARDRRWMIVDADRQFVTQRSNPELARIGTRLEEGRVMVDIPGEGEFSLVAGSEECRVRVWRDWTKAVYGGNEASDALSRYCGETFRFVFMPDETFRRVDASRVTEYRRVSFADGFPLLIINLASLEELNSRLQTAVEMRRFRPNIVVEGAAPWEEDEWKALSVNNIVFSLVKPCSRCVMTTVDPDRGVKAPDLQPLRELGTYRRTADGVIFGMNAVHESAGEIRVGSPVTFATTVTTENQ